MARHIRPISEQTRRAIYTARANGMTFAAIAKRYLVGIGSVHRICQEHELVTTNVNPGAHSKACPSTIERAAQ